MIKNSKNNKKKKGFTLIELIIVIAIIAILAVVAIPKFGEVRKNANVKSDVANAKTIANAVTSLIAENELTVPSAAISIDKTATDAQADKIEEYLQNVPTLKSETGNFKVTIADKGGVTVSSDKYVYFPTADGMPVAKTTTTTP